MTLALWTKDHAGHRGDLCFVQEKLGCFAAVLADRVHVRKGVERLPAAHTSNRGHSTRQPKVAPLAERSPRSLEKIGLSREGGQRCPLRRSGHAIG